MGSTRDRRGLGELEGKIMRVLWDAEVALTVEVVRQRVGRCYSHWVDYSTIETVLRILVRKGLLTRKKEGRAWAYVPTEFEAEFTARVILEVLGESADAASALIYLAAMIDARCCRALHAQLHNRLT